jgi:hypothetical protein
MNPTSPSLRSQHSEAQRLADYLNGMISGEDDKSRLVGKLVKSTPKSPEIVYTRAARSRDWTLLPHRRKQQGERAVANILKELARFSKNEALMAMPGMKRAIDLMKTQLENFSEVKVWHLKPWAEHFSGEAMKALKAAERAEGKELVKEEESQRASDTKHRDKVELRKGTDLEKVDLLFDRRDGQPSAADELKARTSQANVLMLEVEEAAEVGRTPGRATDPFISGLDELKKAGTVAQHLTKLQKEANKSGATKDKNAVLAYQKDARVREALDFDKKVGDSLRKHGIPDIGSQNCSYASVQSFQTASRFEMHAFGLLNSKSKDELKNLAQEIETWHPTDIGRVSIIAKALAELSEDPELSSSRRETLKAVANGYAELLAQVQDDNSPYKKVLDAAAAVRKSPEAAAELFSEYGASYAKAKVE